MKMKPVKKDKDTLSVQEMIKRIEQTHIEVPVALSIELERLHKVGYFINDSHPLAYKRTRKEWLTKKED